MTAWPEFAALLLLIAAVTPVLGRYMADVFSGRRTFAHAVLEPLERAVYAACRIDAGREMTWTAYFGALVAFTVVSGAVLDAMLLWQHRLPLNPQHAPGMSWLLALNVAVSFVTTTNWQPYAGETALGYFAQMAGLAWQNFVAAAVGIAVAIALVRSLSRSRRETIGNFWVDLTRALLYVLLPLSCAGALVLLWQGTPQNLAPYTNAMCCIMRGHRGGQPARCYGPNCCCLADRCKYVSSGRKVGRFLSSEGASGTQPSR